MKHRGLTKFSMSLHLLWGELGFLSIIMIVLFGYQKGTSLSDILKLSIISIILTSILIFYVYSQHLKDKGIAHFNFVLSGTYLFSLFSILLTKGSAEVPLWLIGGLFIALVVQVELGYMVTYNLLFFTSLVGGLEMNSVIYLLIIGSLLCMLSSYFKKLATAIYATIIVVSTQIILMLILNNFMIENIVVSKAILCIVTDCAVIAIAISCYYLYFYVINKHLQKLKIESETNSNLTVFNQRVSISPPISSLDAEGFHTLDDILDLQFPLAMRLKSYSENLYNHSIKISDISRKAAKEIGIDEKVAAAGGLYHEIGKIVGNEYIREGINLAEAYHLPTKVIDIIKQHNLKYENPKTPEAAIVMISISLQTSINYFNKSVPSANRNTSSDPAVSIEKIVDNIFQLRLDKGSLDESSLTLGQYNKLKKFYIQLLG